MGLAICTDGVGSKSVVADMMKKYDTIGIDCVAMNVNDVICVGARPLSMVDYIAVGVADMLGAIAIGLAEGARQAGISISGGEIAQLKNVVTGFNLVGMAVGLVPLDHIVIGQDLVPGDALIGIGADGMHANGLTLARRALFAQGGLSVDQFVPELGTTLGAELLKPTPIYVREVLDILAEVPRIKALVNITGDGLLNLPRVAAPVGFDLDNLPPAPRIFRRDPALGRHRRRRDVCGLQLGGRVLRARRGSRLPADTGHPRAPRPPRAGNRPCRRRPRQARALAAATPDRPRQALFPDLTTESSVTAGSPAACRSCRRRG
jgi:phosphoribosylformylglycinamidine cyclo-ligase